MAPVVLEILLFAFLLALLFVALHLGYKRGYRAHHQAEAIQPQVGAIKGATLGLLALLLGFSFSGASSRFLDRQGLIIDLANAIDTARLRAELLPPQDAATLQNSLQDFARAHLQISTLLRHRDLAEADASLKVAHASLWKSARLTVAQPQVSPEIQSFLLTPFNETLDVSSKRLALARNHLPVEIVILLVASAALSVFVLGYGCGLTHQPHRLLTVTLTLLITMALWIIIDLDFPRLGFIQISDQPLTNLLPTAP